MLRMRSETGWWLITHPDHARLAGEFAAAWGNALFRRPEPRARVLDGIATHDDGWALRDLRPGVTREGRPAAFSTELVGKYSAFEEIDLADYLAVRERAVRVVAERDAYAGLLVALHTYNLLTERADRSTIAPELLPLLDEYLAGQREYQRQLVSAIDADATLTAEEKDSDRVHEHFYLLQACDNLSLLACVAYDLPATLLHPMALQDGGAAEVQVLPVGCRRFQLKPWPFVEVEQRFRVPARHVDGERFGSSAELEALFGLAEVEMLEVDLVQG